MKSRSRLKPSASLQLRAYDLIERAVEEGIRLGINRWQKYRAGKPLGADEQGSLVDHLDREIMGALCEVVRFEPEGEETR